MGSCSRLTTWYRSAVNVSIVSERSYVTMCKNLMMSTMSCFFHLLQPCQMFPGQDSNLGALHQRRSERGQTWSCGGTSLVTHSSVASSPLYSFVFLCIFALSMINLPSHLFFHCLAYLIHFFSVQQSPDCPFFLHLCPVTFL